MATATKTKNSKKDEATLNLANAIEEAKIHGIDPHKITGPPPRPSRRTDDLSSLAHEAIDSAGFIGEVIAHNLANAHRPQPILALASAIALGSVLIGQKVRDKYNTRPNLQLLSAAYTGFGKDYGRVVNKEILEASGNGDLLGDEEITSDTALYRMIQEKPACLYQSDEFGRFLKASNNVKSSHLYSAVSAMMKLATKETDTSFRPKRHADSSVNPGIVINQPFLVINATSTPETLYDSLGASAVSDGFVGRLLLFESKEFIDNRLIEPKPIPESIIRYAAYWKGFKASEYLKDQCPHPVVIDSTPEAIETLTAFMREADAQCRRDSVSRMLWVRAFEKASKLAIVLACSRNYSKPVIDEWAARFATRIVRACTLDTVRIANESLGVNEQEKLTQKLLGIITDSPQGIRQSDLTRKSQWLTSKQRECILRTLMDAQQVTYEPIGEGRSRTIIYHRVAD